MAQHHGRSFQEEGEGQPDMALKRALRSEAATGQVRHQVWRRELGSPAGASGSGGGAARTEGASVNTALWLLPGTGEAVGSWSQESSPEAGELAGPPFEISGSGSLGGQWAESGGLGPLSPDLPADADEKTAKNDPQ